MNDDYDNNKNILYKTEFFKNTSIWVQYNNNLLRYYMHKKHFASSTAKKGSHFTAVQNLLHRFGCSIKS